MRHRYDRYSSRRGWGGFAPYVPVAQRRADAEKQCAKLLKQGETLHPVTLAGFAMAAKWWGKAWCKNLERYADFSNRVGRGRSYVRNGMVLDLRIASGVVTALVQGSRPQPYKINVKIAPLAKEARAQVEAACRGQIGSLADLLAGQFPKALEALFAGEKTGLFPTPKEITFDCSCPDWASMCKHVAAVLYGIGARFDEDPGLFFTLRGMDPQALIGDVVQQRTGELLAKTAPAAGKVLADADLGAVFGIEMATPGVPVPETPPAVEIATVAKPRGRKAKAVVLPSPALAAPIPAVVRGANVRSRMVSRGSRQNQLLAVMRAHGRHESAPHWTRKIGWTESQTRTVLAGLMAKGRVTCPAKGRYLAS